MPTRIAWPFFAVCIAACAPVVAPIMGPVADDDDAFRVVVGGVRQEARGIPLSVDPRPLLPDPVIVEIHSESYASVPPQVIEKRTEVLRELNVDETTDASLRGCASATTAPPPVGVEDPKSRCPEKPIYLAAISLPRSGGAYFPGTPIDNRDEGKRRGQVSERVLLTQLSKAGASTRVYDFVLQRGPGGWTIHSKVVGYLSD
jgi:hypothetical protein